MSPPIPSPIANIALAAGVAAAMGIAVALALTHSSHRADPVRSDRGERTEPADAATLSPPRGQGDAAFSVARLRASADQPFEPPPPIEEAASAPVPATPPDRQVAALPPADPVAESDAAIPPPRAQPAVPAAKPARAPARPAPRQTATAEPAARDSGKADAESGDAADGVKLAGPAIVTGPLELNVDGKPLELYGIKPPGGDDVCSPGGDIAARSCRDVSRQALAARIGLDGDVTCHILAVGGRSTLPATCTDGNGGDLALYLVAHGFALADPNEIVDYSGAEARAKDARAGLWSNR